MLTNKKLFPLSVSVILPLVASLSISMMRFPLTSKKINIEDGAEVFNKQCASCHSITSENRQGMGPNLYEIAKLATHRKPSLTPVEYILESIVDPDAYIPPGSEGGMPNNIADNLNDDSLKNLIAFLISKSQIPDYHDIVNLKVLRKNKVETSIESKKLNDIQEGMKIFRGKGMCITCHSLSRYPGFDLMAPSLLNIGTYTKEYLYESIREPGKKIAPGYQQKIVYTKNQKTFVGRLTKQSDEEIILISAGSLDTVKPIFIKSDAILKIEDGGFSMMPQLSNILTEEELRKLVLFLITMRK